MVEKFRVALAGSGQKPGVDMESRTIKGVIVAQKMKPKDSRNFVIDDNFIQKYMKIVNGKKQKTEVNHNYMSIVGLKLGYVDNFSTDGTSIFGDLHVYSSADLSPIYPGIGDYVLKSVDEDPASYMLSMKVQIDKYFGNDKSGTRQELERWYDWDKGFYWRYKSNKEEHKGEVFGNPTEAKGIDVVGEGALTNSMFSTDEFDQEEHFMALLESEAFRSFMTKNKAMFNINQPGKAQDIYQSILKLFGMDLNTQIQEKERELAELRAQLAGTQTTPAPVPAAPAEQMTTQPTTTAAPAAPAAPAGPTVAELQAQIQTLTATVERLSKAPAGEHAGANGSAGTLEAGTKVTPPLYLLNSINKPLLQKWCKENDQDINQFITQ